MVVALKRFGLNRGVIVMHAQRDEAVSDGCVIDIVAWTLIARIYAIIHAE